MMSLPVCRLRAVTFSTASPWTTCAAGRSPHGARSRVEEKTSLGSVFTTLATVSSAVGQYSTNIR